ncbi:glycosyltransferase family 4 protein [soil metagenome]
MTPRIAIVLKGYPRLSETFIAQELRGLEQAGLALAIVSLRRPTDKKRHPVHDEIAAPVHYLPEYLHKEPMRVIRAWLAVRRRPGYARARRQFLRDYARDRTRNRVRRFGQAVVLAAEFPAQANWLHAHFLHTPASVTAYASLISGIGWSCSAHAKDIWTTLDWELREKLGSAQFAVTCTRAGYDHLRSLAPEPSRVHLSYHGLDLTRFSGFTGTRSGRDGSDFGNPVVLLSVGRAVEKKGYDTLLDALARLPKDIAWRFIHIGGGEKLPELKEQADRLGLAERIAWHGALAQEDVLAQYRSADLFVLACRIARDGDRDGLPNVLVEASSQALCCVSTAVSGVPELLSDGENGLVIAPDNPDALAAALEIAIRDPTLRRRLGRAAEQKVRTTFDYHTSIAQLTQLFASVR